MKLFCILVVYLVRFFVFNFALRSRVFNFHVPIKICRQQVLSYCSAHYYLKLLNNSVLNIIIIINYWIIIIDTINYYLHDSYVSFSALDEHLFFHLLILKNKNKILKQSKNAHRQHQVLWFYSSREMQRNCCNDSHKCAFIFIYSETHLYLGAHESETHLYLKHVNWKLLISDLYAGL